MKRYRVKPGIRVDLKDWDPSDTSGCDGSKDKARAALTRLHEKLRRLQEVLYAERRHRVLVILQAMDTGGKDGTIRQVFEGVNPQGVRVAAFKRPTPEELDHDYLWRIHKRVPARGEIVIFNRSHYEDVLAVRVLDLVPKSTWSKRFDQINDFERMLADEGTTILKFYLHIDKAEQARRLQARLDDPEKHWKFNPEDLDTRRLWPEYMKAYEAVLRQTSTPWAPWHVVPSNHKWYRNFVVARILVDALRGLRMEYPKADYDPAKIRIR
jgi:PPK2 family polyphosphate:nucleotide phosphotransferase